MKVLFIIDPVEKLDPAFDTTLGLLRVFHARGCETWTCDTQDLAGEKDGVFAAAAPTVPLKWFKYRLLRKRRISLFDFQLILMRKEPPFDAQYVSSTHLLDLVSSRVFVSNNPAGIRNTNEKTGILNFPEWIPQTIVTADAEQILKFQGNLKKDIVLKPLDLKGGSGIIRLKYRERNPRGKILRAVQSGRKTIMAQEFLQAPEVRGDKRILVLDGEVLTAYEKHFRKGEFRANISLGGTIHPTTLTGEETALVKALKPYILREGLHLTGIDVMMGKLIEINVTCPAGVMEAKLLYPQSELVEAWADSLEKKVREKKKSGDISRRRARVPYK